MCSNITWQVIKLALLLFADLLHVECINLLIDAEYRTKPSALLNNMQQLKMHNCRRRRARLNHATGMTDSCKSLFSSMICNISTLKSIENDLTYATFVELCTYTIPNISNIVQTKKNLKQKNKNKQHLTASFVFTFCVYLLTSYQLNGSLWSLCSFLSQCLHLFVWEPTEQHSCSVNFKAKENGWTEGGSVWFVNVWRTRLGWEG